MHGVPRAASRFWRRRADCGQAACSGLLHDGQPLPRLLRPFFGDQAPQGGLEFLHRREGDRFRRADPGCSPAARPAESEHPHRPCKAWPQNGLQPRGGADPAGGRLFRPLARPARAARLICRGPFHPLTIGFGSGRGSAWLERLVRDQEVGGSNPLAPTILPFTSRILCQIRRHGRDPLFVHWHWRSPQAAGSVPITPRIVLAGCRRFCRRSGTRGSHRLQPFRLFQPVPCAHADGAN